MNDRTTRRSGRVSDADFARLLEFRDGLRRFLRWSEDRAREVGLTAAQHQLLLAIRGHRAAEPPTVGEVAAHLLLKHHSAVGLVDRAEALGLVERLTDPGDHRVVRLRLTPAGHHKLDDLSAQHLEELDRLAPSIRPIWDGLAEPTAANPDASRQARDRAGDRSG